MSIKITANGIESSGDIEIKSNTGSVSIEEAVPSLPRKVRTVVQSDEDICVGEGEGLVIPPFTLEGGGTIVETGGYIKVV